MTYPYCIIEGADKSAPLEKILHLPLTINQVNEDMNMNSKNNVQRRYRIVPSWYPYSRKCDWAKKILFDVLAFWLYHFMLTVRIDVLYPTARRVPLESIATYSVQQNPPVIAQQDTFAIVDQV